MAFEPAKVVELMKTLYTNKRWRR